MDHSSSGSCTKEEEEDEAEERENVLERADALVRYIDIHAERLFTQEKVVTKVSYFYPPI